MEIVRHEELCSEGTTGGKTMGGSRILMMVESVIGLRI